METPFNMIIVGMTGCGKTYYLLKMLEEEYPQGPEGPKGSGGLSDTGFTMRGDINMGNNKITNLPDPSSANDPITKQYANRVYLTDGGFTMQDNIGMNNHEVLGLNPVPSDGTAAVSKSITDTMYIKKVQILT